MASIRQLIALCSSALPGIILDYIFVIAIAKTTPKIINKLKL